MSLTPGALFGVCILQIEVQPEHLLIKVITTRYLAPGARRALTTQPTSYASMEEALHAAQTFVESFGSWEQETDGSPG